MSDDRPVKRLPTAMSALMNLDSLIVLSHADALDDGFAESMSTIRKRWAGLEGSSNEWSGELRAMVSRIVTYKSSTRRDHVRV